MGKKLSNMMATWFEVGLAPKAPGTFGSLGAVPLAVLLAYFTGIYGVIAVATILFFVGVWAVKEVTKDSDETDPSEVVIDEVVGQLLTISMVTPYLYRNMHNWWIYIVSFALFRLFDIVKVGPVKYFDNRKDAWGVMLDDVAAGIMGGAILYGICYYVFQV